MTICLFPVVTRSSLCISLLHILVYGFSIVYIYLQGLPYVSAAVEQLLAEGTRYLAAGQLNEALSLYTQAVDEDPKNYLSCFRRGTAYLALGNVRMALPDFEEAVRLNGRYVPAIKQRANVYFKMGSLDNARQDLDLLWKTYKDDESREKLSLLDRVERDMEQMNILYKGNNWKKALEISDNLVEVMPFCKKIRELRAQCYIKINELEKGIEEMRYGVRLLNDNREGLLALANLMYKSGLAVRAVEEIRECLRLDQEHAECKKLYRILKKLSAAVLKAQSSLQANSYSDCIDAANTIIALEPNNQKYTNQARMLLCQCHARSQSEEALSYCLDVATNNPHDLDLQCDLAESYINTNQFDKGIEICQTILGTDRRHHRAHELLKKAQNLRKASKRPDYYKILGVSRSATKKQISRAYRELAKKWHPDSHPEKDKPKAQEKFMEITSAKDVLTDDDMRKRYDNGEDPLDPTNQQEHQQYGGPFGPFGGFTFSNMHPFDGHFEFHFG